MTAILKVNIGLCNSANNIFVYQDKMLGQILSFTIKIDNMMPVKKAKRKHNKLKHLGETWTEQLVIIITLN